jgi:hypothetical protein
MIFFHLPRYRRHIYVYGQPDILKEQIIPTLRDVGNIEIHEKLLKNPNDEIINLKNLGKGDLVIIDDLSDVLAKHQSKLNDFLNKAFTTSRHAGYDIIVILHKLKLNNVMVRQNASKIIITGISNDILNEFGEHIINPNFLPIILNPMKGYKQEMLEIDDKRPMGKGMMTAQDLVQRVTINKGLKMPRFVRQAQPAQFIEVKNNSEVYNFKVPDSFEKLLLRLNKKGNKMYLEKRDPFIFDEIKKESEQERKLVNEGELKAGNDNVNKNKIFVPKQRKAK